MIVTLESTDKIIELETPNGRVPARLWEGRTSTGIACHALITRIAVHKDDDASQFQAELLEQRAPTPAVAKVYETRMVL
jgi:hypothetical protein